MILSPSQHAQRQVEQKLKKEADKVRGCTHRITPADDTPEVKRINMDPKEDLDKTSKRTLNPDG